MDAVETLLVRAVAISFIVPGIVCLCVCVGTACYAVVYAVRLRREEEREKRQDEIRNMTRRAL
jgi:ribosomal protein S26